MAKVWVTMEPSVEKPGWFSATGFHLEEPEKFYECWDVDDPEEFIAHMRRRHSIPEGPYSREQYEATCALFGVEPKADSDIDGYGMEYGNFGMSHYHSNPANRSKGIAATIHQRRYRALKPEREAAAKAYAEAHPAPEPKMVKCSCGHTVREGAVMNASMGTSCPDCYDRMSD